MKKSCLWNLTLGMFLVFFMPSCSITPRYHSFGYQLEWKSFHGKEIEKSNSKCNGDTEHETEKYAQHKSAPNAEISPIGITEAGSDKEEFRAEPAVAMRQSSAEAIKIANPQNSESAKLQNVEISGNAVEPKNKGENSDVRPSLTMNKTVQPTYPYQTRKLNGKNLLLQHQSQQKQPTDPMELIFLIVGIIGMLLGYDSYSGGGGWGGGGGRGGYFDWTAFWAISSVVIAAGGVIAAIALKGVFKPGNYIGMLILPFTVLGLPAGIIGLIKSIRDYYDVGKYLSIAALALLGVMWIIGLL